MGSIPFSVVNERGLVWDNCGCLFLGYTELKKENGPARNFQTYGPGDECVREDTERNNEGGRAYSKEREGIKKVSPLIYS